jgi:hypothetical protein
MKPGISTSNSFRCSQSSDRDPQRGITKAGNVYLLRLLTFSWFTACGSWEDITFLDYLVENNSDVRPDAIHACFVIKSAPIPLRNSTPDSIPR